MKKLLIFDGNSIVNRAFYGVRMLTTKEGLCTNAVFGFLNILFKYIDSEKPDYMVVTFDLKAPTFRHKKYELYKAQRKGMPDELAQQMPVLKEVLGAMNIAMLSMEGYEADDLIGTVAKLCENSGVQCIIATGDRDSLQLVSDTTTVYLTSSKQGAPSTDVMTPQRMKEKYGITPEQVVDLKSLMGDASDNIPGVGGIGEKTALRLIEEYGSLNGVYENLNNIKGSVKTKLENDKEQAYLSRELAEINCSVPIESSLENFAVQPYNNEKLKDILLKLEFKNILAKLALPVSKKEEKKNKRQTAEIAVVTDSAAAAEATADILTFEFYSYHLFHDMAGICAVAVNSGKKCYYFSFGTGLLASFGIEDIKAVFENPVPKYSHSCKTDITSLAEYGIKPENIVFDTSIAAYIADPLKNGYDIGLLLGFETYDEVFGKGKKQVAASEIETSEAAEYAEKMTSGIIKLKNDFEETLRQRGQLELFYDVEMPLAYVLADMEMCGFTVDMERLRVFGGHLQDAIDIIEKEIYRMAGGEFNINSTKQLGEILFERLELPVIRKTKTGYSTDADVLDRLSGKHEIIDFVKEYRTLVKLKSTYVDGLIPVISKKDSKIHSKFNQTVTATGRISSTEPNLQNIPVRMELGREMRKMFTAKSSDYVLLDADYSQIELRVLAHISGDETLTDAFKTGKDIHAITASQVFGVSPEEVTGEMRGSAKAVNFGIVYGISDFALAGDLHITRKMAKEYIESYLNKYPKVKLYMENIVESAKEKGYVETIMNRRRYIPELKSQKYTERSFGERVALNTPVQGSAADIIKVAMVKVYKALKSGGYKSKLILQVHDELIVEALKSEAKEVKRILKENMENAVKLTVPLTVDVNEGDSWYDAK